VRLHTCSFCRGRKGGDEERERYHAHGKEEECEEDHQKVGVVEKVKLEYQSREIHQQNREGLNHRRGEEPRQPKHRVFQSHDAHSHAQFVLLFGHNLVHQNHKREHRWAIEPKRASVRNNYKHTGREILALISFVIAVEESYLSLKRSEDRRLGSPQRSWRG
jgi:hypothetical protein